MINAKAGLLPLYISLYDEHMPERRKPLDEFYATIATEFESRSVTIVRSDVCRTKEEFGAAIGLFEKEDVDAVVTLHLAYSPSLESIEALSGTDLDIVVLDTTPDYDFSPKQSADAIMHNHGIHGVQDMCNLLIRQKKQFTIEAGHWQKSNVLDRVADRLKARKLADAMKNAKVGRIGESFRGMGDFSVPTEILKKTIGMTVIEFNFDLAEGLLPAADNEEVRREIESDRTRFQVANDDRDSHVASVRAGFILRRWVENEGLTAATFNFLAFDPERGFPTVPFLEASKGMARGIGYAGEGDVLTAALVGALASVYPETTFTEAFCPNWADGTLFMSHMGEANIDLYAEKPPLATKPFVWTDVTDPVVPVGRLKGGGGILINLAPGYDNRFTLLICPGEMMAVEGEDRMADTVHGWFKPQSSLDRFLAEYSGAGGTHHSAFSYGASTETLVDFAGLMGWESIVLK